MRQSLQNIILILARTNFHEGSSFKYFARSWQILK